MNDLDKLVEMINESETIVFFGGAGVSTSSGIPDFRSKDGLYNSDKYDYDPEVMLSNMFFYSYTDKFYEFYKDAMNVLDYKPNIVHNFLKKLEDSGKLKAIVTQNIDGLHTKAGCKNVYELHGTIYKNNCIKCNKEYSAKYVFESKDIPRCECGGLIKPKVVLYGEQLPEEDYNKSVKAIDNCDLLIVAGTSLTVFPASGLVNLFHGKYLVIINKDKTSYDSKADLVINDDMKEIFEELDKKIAL